MDGTKVTDEEQSLVNIETSETRHGETMKVTFSAADSSRNGENSTSSAEEISRNCENSTSSEADSPRKGENRPKLKRKRTSTLLVQSINTRRSSKERIQNRPPTPYAYDDGETHCYTSQENHDTTTRSQHGVRDPNEHDAYVGGDTIGMFGWATELYRACAGYLCSVYEWMIGH